MKTIRILTVILCLPSIGLAQSSTLKDVYRAYEDHEDAFSINLNGSFLSFVEWFDEDDYDDDFDEIREEIKSIKILKIPKGRFGMDREEFRRLNRGVEREDFEELMTIDSDDSDIRVMAIERNRVIKDLILIVDGEDEIILFELLGDINPKKVGKFSKCIQFNGI
ncbi:DUF4252 domain-containing protein [Fulvivirgaceae bacterium BMA10]|uniref:DUF4252 domain-containing protein n=1 Tax=Splendidivirga corallicola TaxID=3051826 RepID=A0ABT8KIA1_9BACT|nr:DUF4252 domain-containing protein [Fulvivirgaceae bacterium BMA10]